MPAVQIRDMDQETYELLKASAARHKRSIAQEANFIVSTYVATEARLMKETSYEPEEYDPIWGVRLRKEELPYVPPRPAQRELTPEERIKKWEILEARIKALPKHDYSGMPSAAELIRQDRDELSDRMDRIECEVHA